MGSRTGRFFGWAFRWSWPANDDHRSVCKLLNRIYIAIWCPVAFLALAIKKKNELRRNQFQISNNVNAHHF